MLPSQTQPNLLLTNQIRIWTNPSTGSSLIMFDRHHFFQYAVREKSITPVLITILAAALPPKFPPMILRVKILRQFKDSLLRPFLLVFSLMFLFLVLHYRTASPFFLFFFCYAYFTAHQLSLFSSCRNNFLFRLSILQPLHKWPHILLCSQVQVHSLLLLQSHT